MRSGNREYKQFRRPLFPSYELGLRANVLDLVESIKTGSYEPAEPELVFLPKTSGVLRPLTVLSLTDLMVYQAICNVVADAFQRKDLRRAGRVSFGNIYAGKSSKFLYRSWKRGATLHSVVPSERPSKSGRTWVADFDLVSFFELIDHELLIQVVKTRIANEEFLGLLKSPCRGGPWVGAPTKFDMACRRGRTHRLFLPISSCNPSMTCDSKTARTFDTWMTSNSYPSVKCPFAGLW